MSNISKYQVVVIGGGAAGLMAAGQAAASGAKTLLLEKMPRAGLKLRITGKGRCNLTNTADLNEFIKHLRPDGRFMRQAFNRFFNSDLIAFFEELGVPTVTERGGRVFPASGRAGDVSDALMIWVRKCGVEVKSRTPVEALLIQDGHVKGVRAVDASGKGNTVYRSDTVIITTGGASYPLTGSTGDGYRLAGSAGHTIVPVRPGLVPLETEGGVALRLAGLELRNVKVSLWVDGKKSGEEFGEMGFTPFGVTGPIILTLSRKAVDGIGEGKKVSVSIDLKPALDKNKLNERLLRDLDTHGRQQFKSLLKGLLPLKMIPVCNDLTHIPPDKKGHQITAYERNRLAEWLKNFRIDVIGYRPFDEAIITAGGVDTKEVDPYTMESRIVKRLFFAGEVLDIDGDTGGYNLQEAFSTGWVAGRSAL
jgi:hypothetical protein